MRVNQYIAGKERFNYKNLYSHSFIAEFPNMLVGRVIGKKANNIKKILNLVIYENKSIMIDKQDVNTAKTARLKLDDEFYSEFDTFLDKPKSEQLKILKLN